MGITFTAYVKPESQGSVRAFVIPAKGSSKARAILTSTNTKLKPFRAEVHRTALRAVAVIESAAPWAGKHVPVSLVIDFTFVKPPSVSKKRTHVVVTPDLDKLVRATMDALTGVIYADDAQVVEISTRKQYGPVEQVHVSARVVTEGLF